MQALVMVLNKVDYLESILKEFMNSGVRGATVIDSTGMVRILNETDTSDVPIFGTIKMLLNESYPYNKTIFVVLEDEQVDAAIDAVKKVAGEDLKPIVGILFTVPVSRVEGITR
jgi:nitrogen regulatory protein PII